MKGVGEKTLEIMKEASWYNNWLLYFLEPHLIGDILEVGAGIGSFTNTLTKKGRVSAIDMESKYIKKLKKLENNNFSAGVGDIEKGKYFFENEKFDTIVCLNVLEHIKNHKEALKNMNKLLNKGGQLLLLVPAHEFAYGTLDAGLDHYRRYDKKAVTNLLENAGFNIKKIRYLNLLGLIGWYVNSKLLKKEILPKNQLVIFDKVARVELLLEKYIEPPLGLSVLAIAKKVN